MSAGVVTVFKLDKAGKVRKPLSIQKSDQVGTAGASGTVYQYPEETKKAIKIYHERERLKFAEKIRAMIQVKYNRPHAQRFDLAWPESIVIGGSDEFLGFTMPFFGGGWVDLESLMQASEAESRYGIGEHHRWKIAVNLALAVKALHLLKIYCIDLKPQNVRVNLNGLSVGIIDCDGMSVIDIGVPKSKRFYADKSTPEFWAPENIGVKPQNFKDEEAHDRFALATIIFMLLNRGLHPYQGVLTIELPSAEAVAGKIKHNLYPYGAGKGRITPHKDSLYPYWPDETKALFDRAFSTTMARPSAEEWSRYLDRVNTQLQPCGNNANYHVAHPQVGCPVCARNKARQSVSLAAQPSNVVPFTPARVPKSSPQPIAQHGRVTSGPSQRSGVRILLGILAALGVIIFVSNYQNSNRTIVSNPPRNSTSSSSTPSPGIGEPGPQEEKREPYQAPRRDVDRQPEPTKSPTVEFKIVNNTSGTVNVSFFDGSDRTQIDPVPGRFYIHNGNRTQTYQVSCTAGQSVCYGASVQGSGLQAFWGLGRDGKQPCSGCCMSCPAATTVTKTLNVSDSRRPNPTITWVIRDNTSEQLSVAFYSKTRPGHGWPDWNQNWSMTGHENKYTLSCQAGEQICYGAWVTTDPNRNHWGAGLYGRQGCTKCCGTCDGGTYTASLVD
jgi:serine/threonine protein kinase